MGMQHQDYNKRYLKLTKETHYGNATSRLQQALFRQH